MTGETQLRKQMLQFGRMCYEQNLLVAMDGNLSARLPNGQILCTQAGCHKGLLDEDQLVVIDHLGRKVRGRGEPTSEMQMHLACYQERPDCMAVIHAHPPTAIAFTLAGKTLEQCILPEVVLTLGTVPTVDYATTGTAGLADGLRPYVKKHDAVLMDTHGVVALGSSLLDAFCKLETVEHTAKILWMAQELGGAKRLPPAEAVHLRSMGLKRYGGPPEAVAQADDPGADLPDSCLSCQVAPPEPAASAPLPRRLQDLITEEVLKVLKD